jgi:hypothetical protein
VSAHEFDAEPIVISVCHATGVTSKDLTAVAADLLSTNGGQLRGRKTFIAEVTVHVFGRRVPRFAVVDDHHGPALAAELECGGKSGGGSSDDGDVAVPLDGRGGVISHDLDDRVLPRKVDTALRYSQDHTEER